MFGKNKILKQDVSTGDNLWVQEIFPTIQGEALFAGQPAIFIRLAGCNLRCHFCDTDFESSTTHYTVKQLVDYVDSPKMCEAICTDLVVITGGEPFRQNIVPLVKSLLGHGYRVQLETAGTMWLEGFPIDNPDVTVIVSPKTGKVHEMFKFAHAWKYIIREGDYDSIDGLPVTSTQVKGMAAHIARPLNAAPIYVQPCDEYDTLKNKANLNACVNIAMANGYRISVQTHKILGVA